jgi:two-component system, NarL family, nitrate/nitrite response regulator NarL
MSKSRLSIVVADDHPVVLRGIVEVLQSSRNMKVVATCSHGTAAMEAIRTIAPDVAVLDIAMPGVNGVEVLTHIATTGGETKVVFLTATVPDKQILAAMSRGAKAIMFKDAAPEDLVECVRKVASGGTWFPSELVDAALERETGRQLHVERISQLLTAREREIMLLVAEGLPNKLVARRLVVSEGTVKIHLHNIYQKLGVANRTALTALALAHATQLT